ncbi:MAG TPA: YetF domain-containing protein [Anaerolineae bacterium]|nr:YetF domain-containing protein [Anaerolineae bacterium]
MIDQIVNVITSAFGFGAEELTTWQMGLRAVVVYIIALALVRLGEKRALGENTAFDVVLAIMLGSVASRAITGSTSFWPTLVAAAVLVTMHWLFARIAFQSDRFGTLIKGSHRVLVRDGQIRWDAMKKSNISRNDLLSALRSGPRIADVEKVEIARLERSGDISAFEIDKEPRVVEVSVADGVQTVRIEIA